MNLLVVLSLDGNFFCAVYVFFLKLYTRVMKLLNVFLSLLVLAVSPLAAANTSASFDRDSLRLEEVELVPSTGHTPLSPYALPYTHDAVQKDWHRLW